MLSLKNVRMLGLGAVALGSLISACASTAPPTELVDARVAYQRASAGPAAQLAPADLHQSKVALDRAEAAFSDDPSADRTRDLAYLALRSAQTTQARGSMASAVAERNASNKELQSLQAQGLAKAQGELSQTRAQLSAAGQQLAATGQALANEQQARAAAERRARDAMDKLAVAAALAVKDEPRGTVITIPGNVLFTTAQATLLPAAQAKLSQVAETLKDQQDHKIVIEGHTDSQGTEDANMDLSERRAKAVRDFLVSRGLPAERVSAVGVGQSRPVGDNKTVEGRAQNRRVEIIVQPIENR